MTQTQRFDPRAVRRAFERAAASCDAADVIGARARTEMLARLEGLPLTPAVVLDLGAGTGQASRALRDRYRKARVLALDVSTTMLAGARRRGSWLRRFDLIRADACRLPLRDASVDLVFANLTLPWAADPDGMLAEVRRVLRPRGYLSFSTLGPDTLLELREAWAAADDAQHVHPFADMHDVGDALVRAGFTGPVMDVERLTVTYGSLAALYADLRAAGGENLLSERRRTLTGTGRRQRAEAHYEQRRDADGRLPASCELIYGQAWCPDGSVAPKGLARETVVPLSRLGRRGGPAA
jgi:malonyl-CoA O-methyltransferase